MIANITPERTVWRSRLTACGCSPDYVSTCRSNHEELPERRQEMYQFDPLSAVPVTVVVQAIQPPRCRSSASSLKSYLSGLSEKA
jgi:hypothetical protein